MAKDELRPIVPVMPVDRSQLTPREIQVVRLVIEGHRNRRIGIELSITEGTVKGHLHRIYRKLRVTNRHDAARRAATSERSR